MAPAAPVFRKPYNRPSGEGKHANRLSGGKNQTTAPLARGNAPLSPPTAVLPPEGEVCSTLSFYLLSISRRRAAKTSPTGGGAVGRRGAFSSGEARFACFFTPVRAVFRFSFREAKLYTHRREAAIPPPLNPLNLLNLLNPFPPSPLSTQPAGPLGPPPLWCLTAPPFPRKRGHNKAEEKPFEPGPPQVALFLLLFPLHNARMCWNKKP